MRAFIVPNFSGGTYFIQAGSSFNTNSWFVIARFYKQNTGLVTQTYLKIGTPLLYYKTNGSDFDIYVSSGGASYPRSVVGSIDYGSLYVRMDDFGADVSQMTQITL